MKERIFENRLTSLSGCAVAVVFGGALIYALVTSNIDGAVFTTGIAGVTGLVVTLLLAKDKKDV